MLIEKQSYINQLNDPAETGMMGAEYQEQIESIKSSMEKQGAVFEKALEGTNKGNFMFAKGEMKITIFCAPNDPDFIWVYAIKKEKKLCIDALPMSDLNSLVRRLENDEFPEIIP